MACLIRTFGFPANAFVLAVTIFLLALAVPQFAAASENAQSDMKGYNEQTRHRNMARRALAKGRMYLEDKSYGLARESLIEALRLHQDLHEARFCLGLTEYRDGKYKLAVAQFESLYKRQASYPMLCQELARGYLALRECSVADRWLKIHLEREEKNKETEKLKRAIKKCTKDQEKRN